MSRSRRIWLTGASSGIGQALAKQLLQTGHRLALSARRETPLQALADAYPAQVLVVPGDLAAAEQVQAIAAQIEARWGALDTVILNAGTCEYIDASQFEAALVGRVLQANLQTAAHCIEAALPLLRRGARPHLVGVASAVTYLPMPRAGAYGASKAGLRYLLESLRIDLAAERIDVTLVSPGFVDTPLTRRNDFPMPMRWSAERAARHIARRLERRPLDIAFPALFIAALRCISLLPARLQFALGQRMARRDIKERQS
ncbi:SDR family NAD(P)-dependent oxidoreductase [Pseudomonas sp.]|uniref:SDR family NAD(P)-dependent oxidoreductase n=1 Tax=Pseudomonas sp. TaxID=306 RepID=UPI0028AD4ECF|nr:SDR family NAD(P)-dependent oxidoreductase [Pseudomonas sp.]